MKKTTSHLFKIFVLLLCAGIFSASAEGAHYTIGDVSMWEAGHPMVGRQWMVTVRTPDNTLAGWHTYGGHMGANANLPNPLSTWADLVANFNSVYFGEFVSNVGPIHSLFLLIKEGQGYLDIVSDLTGVTTPLEHMDVLLRVPGYTESISTLGPSSWRLHLQANEPHVYGSRFGWLTVRQSWPGGRRESINIPVVVANVFDFTAGVPGNELHFDMVVRNHGGDIVTRRHLRWGAAENETRNLGTFFLMDGENPNYSLTAHIANRTGMRYLFQRYDMLPGGVNLLPNYWSYDLEPYPTTDLLQRFRLGPQSQVAPGLVTTYRDINMYIGFGSTRNFFRLYPFVHQPSALHELNFTYSVVGGMRPLGRASAGGWAVNAFNLQIENSPHRAFHAAIRRHTGGYPAIVPASYNFSSQSVTARYFKAEAFRSNSFMISANVPDALSAAPETPILPMRVRMRISRFDIPGRWNDALRLEREGVLAANLHTICTIRLYSQAAGELYANLFEALQNRAREANRHENYFMENSIQAFTYGDFLYVDFMVLLADAESQTAGKTAFVQVVSHDTVYYILIGDGSIDDAWRLGFLATAAETPSSSGNDGDGGGGCNSLGVALFALAVIPALRRLKRK